MREEPVKSISKRSDDTKEITLNKGDMSKILRGENVKEVLPGQSSNIPLHKGDIVKPTKVLEEK